MADTTFPPDVSELKWNQPRPASAGFGRTERLVHETWRHYYVARLAEAQFGPDSLEASVAQSRALESYRELRGSLRQLDPYYRPSSRLSRAPTPAIRHLQLVRDDAPEFDAASEL